ncbi:MAG: MFS transporter [Anaerolineae bacterium]|nr:MFS transporter [Anaerolineae bacterium]
MSTLAVGGRSHVAVLSMALAVVMLGYGMVIPILPFYVERLGASGSSLGLLIAAYAVMQLVCVPIWGSVSDRVGRKPILLIGMVGNGLTALLFGLANELWMLFLIRSLAGILSSALLPTAMAYVGDSTSERGRGSGMGLLGAALGVGMVFGPILGGWLAGDALSTPFFVTAGLSLVALVPLALLPESLPAAARPRAGRRPPPGLLREWARVLRGPLGAPLFMAFVTYFGMTAFYAIFGLYALEKFACGPDRVGTILTGIGGVSAIAQGVLAGLFIRRWGEVPVIQAALLANAVGFVLLTLAGTYRSLALAAGFLILANAVLNPAVTALASKRSTLGQGTAMGLSNASMSLGRVAGPLWAGFAFDLHANYPYLGSAVVLFAGLLVSLV